jgi:hypothetical protein
MPSEEFWKARVERDTHDVRLAHNRDYDPYHAAVPKKRKRGGTTGVEEEENKD